VEEAGPVRFVRGYLRRITKRPPKFKAMTEAAKELWYHRVDQIRQGKPKRDAYRHHPLEELAVLIKK
jgi:hypothetical protein